MQRFAKLFAPAILILGLGLTGCDSNDNAAKEPAPVEDPAADQDLIEPAGGGETTMPGNAKPASSRFRKIGPNMSHSRKKNSAPRLPWPAHSFTREPRPKQPKPTVICRSEEHTSELQSRGH